MCWSSLSTASCRRLKVILFLDTNMLFHPKLMFCDESATQLFLVACTRLYTSLCWSVGWSVNTSCFWAFRAKRRADFSYCPCPANILPPTRTQLMLPCIRPCYCYQYLEMLLLRQKLITNDALQLLSAQFLLPNTSSSAHMLFAAQGRCIRLQNWIALHFQRKAFSFIT